jgi:hypothetical protein
MGAADGRLCDYAQCGTHALPEARRPPHTPKGVGRPTPRPPGRKNMRSSHLLFRPFHPLVEFVSVEEHGAFIDPPEGTVGR